MEKKKYLIVTAGGHGTRMGSSVPKQFLAIGEKPVLQLTIEKFLEAVPDVKVVTVLPKTHIATWKSYCFEHNFICPQILVEGGITRFHSVRNALEKVPDGALVAVHDGVRPFVTKELIRKLFSLAETSPAVIPVTPVTDTLKVLVRDGEGLLKPVAGASADRSVLYGAQTPQVFSSDILKKAYCCAYDTAFTDDASVVERTGTPLSYIEGERLNIKITTPEDLVLANALTAVQKK
ncbi:MAG: 2-C-methyl-D-erythritol 4-phosphate cytidylyltransferase [Candidatus Cryptobacteroides sp.]